MEKVRVHVCKNNALYVCSLGLFGGGGVDGGFGLLFFIIVHVYGN